MVHIHAYALECFITALCIVEFEIIPLHCCTGVDTDFREVDDYRPADLDNEGGGEKRKRDTQDLDQAHLVLPTGTLNCPSKYIESSIGIFKRVSYPLAT